MHLHRQRLAADAGDRRDVAQEIVIQLVVERGVHRIADRGEQERIAVSRSLHDDLGGDIAAGAGAIVDDE